MQDLVVVQEDHVEDHFLEARFELLVELSVLDEDGVLAEFGIVKLVDAVVDVRVEFAVLHELVDFHQPVVQLFLLFGDEIGRAKAEEELLEGADHPAEEADADHLDYKLEAEFQDVVAGYVAVADRGEGRDHPVDRSGINTRKVRLLYVGLRVNVNPPLVHAELIAANQ